MSRRHVIRRLPDGRWVCGASGCDFSDLDLAVAVKHSVATPVVREPRRKAA